MKMLIVYSSTFKCFYVSRKESSCRFCNPSLMLIYIPSPIYVDFRVLTKLFEIHESHVLFVSAFISSFPRVFTRVVEMVF